MAEGLPPFGNYADPDVERALDWMLGFLEVSDWHQRSAQIESQLEATLEPRSSREAAQTYQPVSISDDRVAWYLYLVDTVLHAPLKYDPTQGARVVPIFKRLGADLDLLTSIKGVNGRVARILTNDRRQPD